MALLAHAVSPHADPSPLVLKLVYAELPHKTAQTTCTPMGAAVLTVHAQQEMYQQPMLLLQTAALALLLTARAIIAVRVTSSTCVVHTADACLSHQEQVLQCRCMPGQVPAPAAVLHAGCEQVHKCKQACLDRSL